ncbi:MAG: Holliday junction resolvase RecU [Bacilli bacterium]
MKYPKGVKLNISNIKTDKISYSNRGMELEKEINISNEYYRNNNIAFIYKKPTPIKIVDVDYPSRKEAIIKKAYFEKPSTTDYNGIYKGKYIDFEAKETLNTTSFPLANIHKHQIEHIRNIINQAGICFLIVRFVRCNITYLLKGEDFIDFVDHNKRKSIPLNFFKEKAYVIKDEYLPRINYIKIIDEVYGGALNAK